MREYRESMKDPSTTLRTDRHRRQSPRRRDVGDSEHDYSKEMDIPEFMEKYPMLAEYAKQIALARLATYNQDKWGTDMGWGETFEFPQNPYPELFDPENLDTMSPKAELLYMTNPDEYYNSLMGFNDWFEHRNEPQLRLKPMTREDAKKDSIPWSQSMDEYMRGLAAQNIINDENQMRLMAQQQMYDILKEDLKSGKPQYEMALRKLLDDKDEYEPADTAELAEKQRPGLGSDWDFKQRNPALNFVLNGVVPFTNRIASDPELWHKAGPAQIGSRALGDAGMLALYALGPEALATRAALATGMGANVMSGGLKSLAARAALRTGAGAGVGAAGWGAKNLLADPLAYNAFGVGTQQGPADLRDLGLEALLGGAGNFMSTGLLRGGLKSDRAFRVREAMNPDKPSAVNYDDIKASFNAMKDKDVVSASSPRARKLFEQTDLEKYKAKYNKGDNREEVMVESNPPMTVNLNPKEGGPIELGTFQGLPKTGQKSAIKARVRDPKDEYHGFTVPPRAADAGLWKRTDILYEPSGTSQVLMADRTGTKHLRDVTDLSPVEHRKVLIEDPSENMFFNRYMEQNKSFFAPYTAEEKAALKSQMKKAQVRESDEAKQFTGRPEYMSGDEWAEMVRATRGDAINGDGANLSNMARNAQLTKKSTPGVRNKKTGEWSTSEKQQKNFAKAKKTMTHRKDMKIVGKDYLSKQRDYQQSPVLGRASAWGGIILNKAGAPFITNNANLASDVIPYGVNFLGPRAEQIEYYEKD